MPTAAIVSFWLNGWGPPKPSEHQADKGTAVGVGVVGSTIAFHDFAGSVIEGGDFDATHGISVGWGTLRGTIVEE